MDEGVPPQGARLLPRTADAHLGRRPLRHRLSTTSTTTSSRSRRRQDSGTMCPPTSRTRSTSWASRRPSEVPGRRRRPVRVRGRLPLAQGTSWEKQGRDLPRHGHGPARARGHRQASTSARSSRQTDNKFAALNTAVWSGGSFVYVPKGVIVDMPLQAYFRINAQNMGQFERTLIIVDEGAYVHYVEGCTAPIYSSDSLHSAWSRSSSRRAAAAATRPSRTGRTTSTTW